MTLSLAQNAIALLIDLAERGEIDPWDVKVIEVIDRFLSKLQPEARPEVGLEAGRAPYEADLSQSGQAFLYASMLLLLKADSLARLEAPENPPEEALLEPEEFGVASLPPNLERRIRRRATAAPVQNRRVTLQELIAQLNLMSAAMADPKPRRVLLKRPRPQSQRQAMKAIAQLAHQENLSEVAAALEQFLLEHWDALEQEGDWLDFEILLQMWADAENGVVPSSPQADSPILPSIHDRVGVFWALLFLSAQSKVELNQEEFYQDLQVRSLTERSGVPLMTPEDLALLD
ncbi:segregation/condensation protein A [Phormidium tenue FACHB-886]|nr:segregation/condensation protein A [Phormidium tenue FACHB-886]